MCIEEIFHFVISEEYLPSQAWSSSSDRGGQEEIARQLTAQMGQGTRCPWLLRRTIDWNEPHGGLVAAGNDDLLTRFRAGDELGELGFGLVHVDGSQGPNVARNLARKKGMLK